MGIVRSDASMSLDGFISGPHGSGFDELFAWYDNGDLAVPTAQQERVFHLTPESAQVYAQMTANVGALIVGRTLLEIARDWGGTHPLGVPVVVVSHRPKPDWLSPDAPFHFVGDGVEAAVQLAKELAGEKDIAVAAGDVAQQVLEAGLLDEISVALVPVLLGSGTPYFRQMPDKIQLEGPEVVAARGVTHLRYKVKRQDAVEPSL